jgi:hypothetical protein
MAILPACSGAAWRPVLDSGTVVEFMVSQFADIPSAGSALRGDSLSQTESPAGRLVSAEDCITTFFPQRHRPLATLIFDTIITAIIII